MASLLEKVNTSSGTWDTVIDLMNGFPFIAVSKDHQRSLFSPGRASSILSLSHLQAYQLSSPNSKPGPQRSWSLFLHDTMLVHFLNDIMLIGLGKQAITTVLNTLLRHMWDRGQKINATKIQECYMSRQVWWYLKCLWQTGIFWEIW